MLLRRSIAAATIALAATGMSAAPAFAKGPAKHAAHAAHAARADRKAHGKFVVVGTVKSSGATSLTILVKGGNQRALRGSEQTVTVAPDASIRRNDADAVLADVKMGDHVMVKGSKDGANFTASKVRAEAPEAAEAGETPEAPESH